MSTATARLAIGSLFGTISTTASTITNTIGTINDSVNMISNYVSTAATKQQLDNKLELEEYEDVAILRVSKERTNRRIDAIKFASQSPDHEKYYQESIAHFKAILAKPKSE